MIQAPVCLYYKSFTIVIYDRNDSGQYYKTLITIVTYDTSHGCTFSGCEDMNRCKCDLQFVGKEFDNQTVEVTRGLEPML